MLFVFIMHVGLHLSQMLHVFPRYITMLILQSNLQMIVPLTCSRVHHVVISDYWK
jgi:hypothetical protein